MTSRMQKAECRTLSEAELECVSGGTSGLMHAVAHAIEKFVYENCHVCETDKLQENNVVCR